MIPLEIIRLIYSYDDELMCVGFPIIRPFPRLSLLHHAITHSHLAVFHAVLLKIKLTEVEILQLYRETKKTPEFIQILNRVHPRPNVLTELLTTWQDIELLKFFIDEQILLPPDIIEDAVKTGNIDFLLYLLEHSDTDPSYENNKPFWTAVDVRCWDTTMLLYSDHRVQPNISVREIQEIFQN